MKTPDRIKQGLTVCCEISPSATACKACPYDEECRKAYEEEDIVPGSAMMLDALAYIRQLERERDAAVRDLDNKSYGCDKCKHHLASIKKTCDLPIEKRKPSFACWEWRGLQEE